MPSSSRSSSSDETPRVERFNDFDFFDSDKDNDTEKRATAKIRPNSAFRTKRSKSPHDDELHGRGGRSVYSEMKQGLLEDENDKAEAKKYTSTTKLEIKSTVHKVRKSRSSDEERERVMIRVPHEGSFEKGQSDGDSSSSVTDVSPLQSPDLTPRSRSGVSKKRRKQESPTKKQKMDGKKQSKTKFVIRESRVQEEERPHARRSNGETLSVEDLLYSTDSTVESSSEREEDKKKKVQRRRKNRHNEIQHRMEASSRHHRRRLLDVAAQNSMDISQLLEVVLEMEQEDKVRRMYSGNKASRSILPPPIKPTRKKNMSFSNQQVRDIDAENQRLLKRLAQLNVSSRQIRPSSASSVRSSASSCRSNASTNRSGKRPTTASGMRYSPGQGPRLYHSATNRIRDQQRIERENLAFLKRLQATKSSGHLRRDNLLRDYQRQTGKPVEPTRPRRRQKSGYSRHGDYDADTGSYGHRREKTAWQDSW